MKMLVTASAAALCIAAAPAFANPQESGQSATTAGKSKSDRAAMMPSAAPGQARQIMSDWPEVSKKAATAMMNKYGEPDEATATMLLWRDTGPFVRTIVYSEPVQHNFPKPHQDVLEQAINYDVPAEKFSDLAAYDGSVIAERTKGELAARCDREDANILALNLADDIINDRKSVAEARQAYAQAMRQVMQGETPQLTAALQFDVVEENINNPDEAVLNVASRNQ